MKLQKTKIWNFQTNKYEDVHNNSNVATVGVGRLPWLDICPHKYEISEDINMKLQKTQIWNFQTNKYENDHNSSNVATVGDGRLPWHIWSLWCFMGPNTAMHCYTFKFSTVRLYLYWRSNTAAPHFVEIWVCICILLYFCICSWVQSGVLGDLRDISKRVSSWVHWLCHCAELQHQSWSSVRIIILIIVLIIISDDHDNCLWKVGLGKA